MALRCVAINGQREVAQLVENGDPAKSEISDGTSVLMQAGMAGHLEVASYLMEALSLLQMMSTAQENRMATMESAQLKSTQDGNGADNRIHNFRFDGVCGSTTSGRPGRSSLPCSSWCCTIL